MRCNINVVLSRLKRNSRPLNYRFARAEALTISSVNFQRRLCGHRVETAETKSHSLRLLPPPITVSLPSIYKLAPWDTWFRAPSNITPLPPRSFGQLPRSFQKFSYYNYFHTYFPLHTYMYMYLLLLIIILLVFFLTAIQLNNKHQCLNWTYYILTEL